MIKSTFIKEKKDQRDWALERESEYKEKEKKSLRSESDCVCA